MFAFNASDFLSGMNTIDLSAMASLKTLYLNNLKTTSFPMTIFGLTTLEDIDINNDFVVVPDLVRFCALPKLRTMYPLLLSPILSLPSLIPGLRSFHGYGLSFNSTSFPACLASLVNLSIMYLS